MSSPNAGKSPGQLSCPTCGKLFAIEMTDAMPFCSMRCKHIDLGRWFDEEYGLPVEPEIDPDEDFYGTDFSLN